MCATLEIDMYRLGGIWAHTSLTKDAVVCWSFFKPMKKAMEEFLQNLGFLDLLALSSGRYVWMYKLTLKICSRASFTACCEEVHDSNENMKILKFPAGGSYLGIPNIFLSVKQDPIGEWHILVTDLSCTSHYCILRTCLWNWASSLSFLLKLYGQLNTATNTNPLLAI